MKMHNTTSRNVILGLAIGLVGLALTASAQTTLRAMPGGLVQIDGTSTIHAWRVRGKLIGGSAEVGKGFPLTPGQEVKAGRVDATVKTFIPVRSLKSVKENGEPYSSKMDAIMYEHLRADKHKSISYTLSELTLKEPAKSASDPYVFESKGELVVAGVTNSITMPVNVTVLEENKVKFSGTTNLKMSDYKVEPPAPSVALGLIKTGDDIKITFEWITKKR